MEKRTVWNLPTVLYQSLASYEESRPVALITALDRWARVQDQLNLPIVVQAEPERTDYAFLQYLAQHVPSTVEVIYAVGGAPQVMAGKVVAYEKRPPLDHHPNRAGLGPDF
ncbi:MAG: hypothetical protein HC915_00545 [Anaerolineae bacterium]|nr:hypothetical protein [Anaerolineae bacterium]